MAEPAVLREFANRFDRQAERLPPGTDRDFLLDLAKEARIRASAKEHGQPDGDPIGVSPVVSPRWRP